MGTLTLYPHACILRSHDTGRKVFKYEHDFDVNGIIHWLGTCGGTQAWSNPCEAGFIKIKASTLMPDSLPLSSAVGRESVRCVTKPERNSWFRFEFSGFRVKPSHYSLRHYDSWDTECLRSWCFEGSNDGVSWVNIVSHRNDTALDEKGATHTWRVKKTGADGDGSDLSKGMYRMFRVIQTGRNSNNNYYLPISGFEVYGRSLYVCTLVFEHCCDSVKCEHVVFVGVAGGRHVAVGGAH